MAQGDLPTPRGGSLRRRREKRQLQQLASASERTDEPGPAKGHVRVVGDQAQTSTEDQADAEAREPEGQETSLPVDGSPAGSISGFHVRAVPIDQPIGE
jgi:hypothetical protein